jgi:putative methyltransferase (TIGR04325 family)
MFSLGIFKKRNKHYFSGNYDSWVYALRDASSYDSACIFEKCLESSRQVLNGGALFARDGVAFKKPQYPWPLLASILSISSAQKGNIRIVDFGGGFGGTYFQCKPYLDKIPSLQWAVVEQPHFVDSGNSEFANESLHFFHDLGVAVSHTSANTILLSSVLPYLEDPSSAIQSILKYPWDYIIIDKTSFILGENTHRLTIQNVPASIFPVKLPAWFFNEEQFLLNFTQKYQVVSEWNSPDKIPLKGGRSIFKGFFFQNLSNAKI